VTPTADTPVALPPDNAKQDVNLLDSKTIRRRTKNIKAATQRFLAIAEIRNDTVILKNGGMRAVLLVEALNFNLKSETEQQGIIAGYGQFVNTLTFPLQIVVRSTRANIDAYLSELRGVAAKQTNELLRQQTLGYADFMEQLLEVADIMQKRFLVIVPLDTSERKKTMLEAFFDWISPDDTVAKAAARNRDFARNSGKLNERVELVHAGLENIGLHSRRMNTRELLTLFYEIYNPKTSQEEKLPEDSEILNTEKTVL
jgi:hypothetical protein